MRQTFFAIVVTSILAGNVAVAPGASAGSPYPNFRNFVLGKTTYAAAKKEIEDHSNEYERAEFSGGYIAKSVVTLNGKKYPLSLFFFNSVLVEANIRLDTPMMYDSALEDFLKKGYGPMVKHGWYKYPTIQRDYTHACNAWGIGSDADWYLACPMAEVVLGSALTVKSASYILKIPFLKTDTTNYTEGTGLEPTLVYRYVVNQPQFIAYHENRLRAATQSEKDRQYENMKKQF